MAELKRKVVRGFAWNIAEKIASACFQAWVTVVVLNHITPGEYGFKAILAAMVSIFNVFVDSGFSQALIRDKGARKIDFSTAFLFNIGMAAAIYAILVWLAYPAARIFRMPELTVFAPVFFLIIPLGALGIVQQTVLSREFDFRRMSSITFASNVGSGLVGVTLAWCGAEFWSIVGMRVSQTAIRTVLFWIFGRWSPSLGFSRASIGRMFGFSSRILGTDLLNNLYNYLPNFVIGRVYPASMLGHYDQARSLRDQFVTSTTLSLNTVMFPALASIRDDDGHFARSVSRVVGSIVFLVFPIMAGLAATAGEIFGFFLKPDWWASAPFFRILCLAGFAAPLSAVAANILRSRSDGRDVLRSEIVKKLIATVLFAIAIPLGIKAIAWGAVGIVFTDAVVSFTLARRQTAYGFRKLARDVLPALGLTAVMSAAVWAVGSALGPVVAQMSMKAGFGVVLAAKIVTGAAVYTAGAAIFKFEAFGELTSAIKGALSKHVRRVE